MVPEYGNGLKIEQVYSCQGENNRAKQTIVKIVLFTLVFGVIGRSEIPELLGTKNRLETSERLASFDPIKEVSPLSEMA
jgi:hypothetical protein